LAISFWNHLANQADEVYNFSMSSTADYNAPLKSVVSRIIAFIGAKLQTLNEILFKPTDAASLATFRILFGAIMVWEVYRYHRFARIVRNYIEPQFHFTYEFFPFVSPLPGQLMYLVFFVWAVSALGLAIGFFYRVSALLFFLSYTYVFLLDKAEYNNHYYLIILLAFLFIWIDAHRWASVDQKLRPNLRAEVVPFWHLLILQAQIVIVYFYGGVAKINIDWLVGQPMQMWLLRRSDYPVVGPVFTTEWAVFFFSYGGLFFDLLIGFLLLWKRTRVPALVPLFFFHLMNKWLFSIGIFPYLMIAATIIFADPDWPRQLLRSAKLKSKTAPNQTTRYRPLAFGFVTIYLALQILIPLRHWLYPNYVAWTEEGHRFSWRMKLRNKSGDIAFFITDPETNQNWVVDLEQDLTDRQISKMSTRPDMIIQYVHYLKEEARQAGIETPIIRVDSWVSLNGRPYQQLVDSTANLAEAPGNLFASAAWLLPFPADTPPQLAVETDIEQ
jgi:uncharacterized membrane protein YphA (DoxX/SURF4 family)